MDDSDSNDLEKEANEKYNESMKLEKELKQLDAKIQNSMAKEVSSSEIGELVMETLKDIDKVAYVRFAAVYKEFDDVDNLLEELKRLLIDKK